MTELADPTITSTAIVPSGDNEPAAPLCAGLSEGAPVMPDRESVRFLAALTPARKERSLSWLVARCYDRNDDTGLWNWLGDRADDLRIWLQHRRVDKGVGWCRLATVGRKVNSADRTSTPPRHLTPLPDECYPPGAVSIPVRPENARSSR